MATKHTPADKNCLSCRYYVATPEGQTDGECHFFPPTVILRAPVAGEAKYDPTSVWPEVMADWLCGQFKAC